MWPNPFFVKIATQLVPREKVAQYFFSNFQKAAQSKKNAQTNKIRPIWSPKRRKFAQSGHPGHV
jgi:hypothetical protein